MIHLPETWHPKAPAADTVIARLISDSPMQLPEAYIELLRVSNGGYADLSASPWAIDFWAAENVLRLNQEYRVDQNALNFLAFGSNLGEEVLAFDKRKGPRSGVYLLPWHNPNEKDALKVSESFERLAGTIKD